MENFLFLTHYQKFNIEGKAGTGTMEKERDGLDGLRKVRLLMEVDQVHQEFCQDHISYWSMTTYNI